MKVPYFEVGTITPLRIQRGKITHFIADSEIYLLLFSFFTLKSCNFASRLNYDTEKDKHYQL